MMTGLQHIRIVLAVGTLFTLSWEETTRRESLSTYINKKKKKNLLEVGGKCNLSVHLARSRLGLGD
jgi:hypothetical protein